MMKEAGKLLSRAGKYVPSAQTLSERLESLRYEMEDILSEAESLQEGVDVSADRLEAVEQRMSLIYDLQKKHGCSTVAELIAIKDALSETLFDSSSLEERRKTLQDDISSLNAKLSKISQELHSSRVKAAIPFGKKIESDIRSLELDKAVFDVQILPSQQSATGTDTVLLRFSSTGRGPVDVAKCASGGELSRIMLCLKAMMARYTNMPTMIFDEIDTGVSGSVADRMGRMICSMGEDMQVFAITHLPQVAANGNAHFLVRKEELDGRTVSTISRIEGEDRVMEIARMLSGTTITPEAVQNARSLLSRAGR
jgi:DNA repair protein RecN (Recombination protein N)